MNISAKKIRDYGINTSIEVLERQLVQLGHEVEAVDDLYTNNLVIGQVIEKEKHPDADKLSVLKVDIKKETLQIVCGAPNVDVNQKVIVATEGVYLANIDLEIKPVSLKGIESNGMICSLAELNLPKKVLNKKDIDGICVLDVNAPIGEDALKYIGLDDQIFDVSLTADRGDCQNYQGIKNDLYAINMYESNDVSINEYKCQENYKNGIENPYTISDKTNQNKYFSHILIEKVNVHESNLVDQIYLMKNNIKPQNNVVDILAIEMLEYGLPMHAYDADKIKGSLNVKQLDKEEKFVGIDEKEYTLAQDTLVICDEEKIVAIAGVMGSFETKITDETRNVLLETAIFNPTLVRLGAKNIFGKTDASIRFEKGVDASNIDIARKFILETLNCSYSNIVETNKVDVSKNIIQVSSEEIETVLGIKISDDKIQSIFNFLNIRKTETGYEVPNARHDLVYKNDLVEEVIRIYGLDNIKTKDVFKTINKVTEITNEKVYSMRKIEDLLINLGLNQVITYSLISEKDLMKFNAGDVNNAVKLMHPMSDEKAVYRMSLVNSLVQTALYNFKRQQKEVNIFEISNTYHYENDELCEKVKIAGLLSGERENYYLGSKETYNFFDLKGIVEALFDAVGLEALFIKPSHEINELNPYAQAHILVDGKQVGFIGEVHPSLIGKNKYPLYVFELEYKIFNEALKHLDEYKQVNEYPTILRDLSLVASKEVPTEKFMKLFNGKKYLSNVTLMDVYTNEENFAGKKSLTFSLEFENKHETLKADEVEQVIEQIIAEAKKEGITL